MKSAKEVMQEIWAYTKKNEQFPIDTLYRMAQISKDLEPEDMEQFADLNSSIKMLSTIEYYDEMSAFKGKD